MGEDGGQREARAGRAQDAELSALGVAVAQPSTVDVVSPPPLFLSALHPQDEQRDQTSHARLRRHPRCHSHPRRRLFFCPTHQVRLLPQSLPCRRKSNRRHHLWDSGLLHDHRFLDHLLGRLRWISARSVIPPLLCRSPYPPAKM